MLALLAGGALALAVSWTSSEAQTTPTTTTPSTETVTSTQTVTSTTTTTATAPTQTTTTTETKTAAAPPPTTITNHTTTVQTAPASQTGNNSSSDVPTWAWVVMGLEALAIVALIVMFVRERDLRTLAETRIRDLEAYPAAPPYRVQEPGYGSRESDYPTQRLEPGDRQRGRGSDPPGSPPGSSPGGRGS